MRVSSQMGFYRWLHQSVRGAARDLRRPERKTRVTAVQSANDECEDTQPSAEILTLLDRAELTERQAAVVLAHVVGREPLAAVARRLGMCPSTARNHFHRAKKKLAAIAGSLLM
jgi:DNA-directed RNA polymerase specialized sigma24 family protein